MGGCRLKMYSYHPAHSQAPADRILSSRGYSAPRVQEPMRYQAAEPDKTIRDVEGVRKWMEGKAAEWACGVKATPADFAEGHHLVYKLCTEAENPRVAERMCYELFIDYIRGVADQHPPGPRRAAAKKALIAIFRYLDQTPAIQ